MAQSSSPPPPASSRARRERNGRSPANASGADASSGSDASGSEADDLLDRVAETCATEARPLPEGFDPQAEGALEHPHLYFNRELSTLDFNRRVLAQALDEHIPLLERVFFLAITASNLDEFFQKRVGGLKRQSAAGVTDLSIDGRRPEEQLRLIRRAVLQMYAALGRLWDERLRPRLGEEAGVHLLDYDALTDEQQDRLDRHFQENIFPILTPLAVGPGRPFPFLSNLSLSLAVMLRHPERGTDHFARVKVPVTQGRWVALTEASAGEGDAESDRFVPLEQLVAQNLGDVFRGMQIESVHAFRVTRNADIRREEEEADDLLEMISDELRERRFAPVVRLEIDEATPPEVRQLLMRELKLGDDDLYETSGLLGHADLMPLARLPGRAAHRFAPWSPVVPPRLHPDAERTGAFDAPKRAHIEAAPAASASPDELPRVHAPGAPAPDEAIGQSAGGRRRERTGEETNDAGSASADAAPPAGTDGREALPRHATRAEHAAFADDDADRTLPGSGDRPSVFRTLRTGGDLLVHHPYDSFQASVQRFIEEAAADPQVLAIKQTLYRTSEDSPVVQALMRAAERGKQVAVLVEVKARFDEKNNIEWGRKLEKSGVHVTYGLVGLKTHAKVTLVVRQEDGGPRTYCHIGTGNYNSETARQYSDLGLLTSKPATGYDLINLFHYLTGYAPEQHYRTLLVAPHNMRASFERLIEAEIEHERSGSPDDGGGRIIAKMNALNDRGVIRALYRAARAGVQIDLIVRGHSLLRPGLEGVSENIRVTSILGRFLEHTRIYYFGNGAAQEPDRAPKVFLGSADWMSRNLDDRVEAVQQVHQDDLRDRLVGILETALADRRSAWDLQSDGRYRPPPSREAPGFQEQLMQQARRRAGS